MILIERIELNATVRTSLIRTTELTLVGSFSLWGSHVRVDEIRPGRLKSFKITDVRAQKEKSKTFRYWQSYLTFLEKEFGKDRPFRLVAYKPKILVGINMDLTDGLQTELISARFAIF